MSQALDPDAQTLVAARGVERVFQRGAAPVHALRGVDLEIRAGEFVTLQGRSGSGKTTLLNVLAGLDNPTKGDIALFGRHLADLSERDRVLLRRGPIGLLFQNAHLLPSLTAQENVELALRFQHTRRRERIQRAQEALAHVGLSDRVGHRALELSGGEQHRVALARALVRRPRLLIGDEPTGALDMRTGQAIIKLLVEMAHQHNIGMLIATHDTMVVQQADRSLQLQDGIAYVQVKGLSHG